MYACTDCRVGGKAPYPACTKAGHNVLCFGSKITIPKKNNKRAWARIAKGEYKWDRRKARGKRGPDTVWKRIYETVETDEYEEPCCDCYGCNFWGPRKIVKSVLVGKKECINKNRKPDVDLGG